MRKITVENWKCDFCGATYGTEEECAKCEKSHGAMKVRLVFDPRNQWWFFESDETGKAAPKKPVVTYDFDFNEVEGNGYLTWSMVVPSKKLEGDNIPEAWRGYDPLIAAKRILAREAKLWFAKMAGAEGQMDKDIGEEINSGKLEEESK